MTSAALTGGTPADAGLLVLVVEDNPADARLVEMQLHGSPVVRGCLFATRLAEVTDEMLVSADCALVDLGLPDTSGLEAVHRLRIRAPSLPVVVLTALDDEAAGVTSLRYGAQDYLVKGRANAAGVARAVRYAVERQRLLGELEHQALHDPLTGLPNRLLFLDRVERALAHSRRSGGGIAVLLTDMDEFKAVNDSFGHAVGDRLLVAVAARLTRVMRPSDTLARLGGDEFTVLCEGLTDAADVELLAERVRAAVAAPLTLEGRRVQVTASVGVTWAPRGATDATVLLRDADTALYAAKEAGRDRVLWFDEALHARVVNRLTVIGEVRAALADGALAVAYQPVVPLDGQATVRYEALVRWRHPRRGLLHPAEFAAALDDSALVTAIDRFVLETAAEAAARWRVRVPDLRMSVNVSGASVAGSSFAPTVMAVLDKHGLPPQALTLEVLESAMLTPSAASALAALRDAGVAVALDDFGVGLSSLTHFLTLEADELKLDAAVVSAAAVGEERPQALVRMVAGGAAELGLPVVAEGIETFESLRLVRDLGVQFGQGYLWGEPALCRDGPPPVRDLSTDGAG